MNIVILLGRLTRDPELRYMPNQTAVATFGLAVNRRYKQGEEWKEEVCFVDITVFGRQAETSAEYLHKGQQVLIEGRLTFRRWEGKDGQAHSKHEVVANRVQFLGQGQGQGQQGRGGERAPAPDADPLADLGGEEMPPF